MSEMIELHAGSIGRRAMPASSRSPKTAEHPESLLALPPGEARESLLALHDILGALARPGLRIYEAGGGSTSYMPLGLLREADVTVVDIDEDQIRNNDYAQQKVVGDIQTHSFPPDSFDLVICYNVIEHLPDVEAALRRFHHALRPGGMILIGAPNPQSLSGFVTKYSPHWFHVWYYRHIKGDVHAGEPGHAPFPTLFHPLVTLTRLVRFSAALGLAPVYRREYESPRYQEMRLRRPLIGKAVDAAAVVLNFLLGGRRDVRHGDYHIILQKR